MKIGASVINFLSGEWVLDGGRPNGGDVVVMRTLWIGVLLILFVAFLRALAELPHANTSFITCVWAKLKTSVDGAETPTILGATYAALYARFTSQWTYIANLYNQIKQAEVETAGAQGSGSVSAPSPATPSDAALVIAQWKAGFIEDALAVHMATKPTIKGVIQAWFAVAEVKAAFMAYTPDAAIKIRQLQRFEVLPIPIP